jgi:hypothetical protein
MQNAQAGPGCLNRLVIHFSRDVTNEVGSLFVSFYVNSFSANTRILMQRLKSVETSVHM